MSSHLDRTSLVNKRFFIWLSGEFFSRDTAGSTERARELHLARSGSQSHRAIWFILPANGASIIREIPKLRNHELYKLCFLSSVNHYKGHCWQSFRIIASDPDSNVMNAFLSEAVDQVTPEVLEDWINRDADLWGMFQPYYHLLSGRTAFGFADSIEMYAAPKKGN